MCNFSLINIVDQLTIFDLNTLTNELKSKFNFDINFDETVTSTDDNTTDISSKPKFKIILSSVKSDKKISVLKAVKHLLSLGLKESKDLVEQVPSIIKQDIFLEEANEIKTQIESAGGDVVIEKMV